MAGDITFVNEADIGFLSAVSLPNLSQALLDNFLDLDSEHESEDDSEDEWSDFSDLSSGNDSSDMSGEESPSRGQKDVRRKKLQENETDEVNFHAAVVLNTIYWALYENFHSAVMQIKIDTDKRKTQTNASEGADTVVDSDFVDVARVSGAALHKLRKGREKIVNGRKGARRVSEATKENYAAEVKIMSEMVCSAEEKTSLPLGLKRLDEGKLTFFNSKFTVVLLTLDKRIREMLTEKNLNRYPKNLMKLTKQSVALDEELQELFLAASKRACTAPFEEIRACSIWQELVKRICNTRFKEFYSAQEEKKLIQEGKVVSADQSLRDKLKTYSVDKRT
ncbi:uncharacterized protein [Montipora foliosa]|uniref:uncharacterized protein n=1 Tax=Montipora foliosa TaxID=591990 RepID=UPI0035F108B7